MTRENYITISKQKLYLTEYATNAINICGSNNIIDFEGGYLSRLKNWWKTRKLKLISIDIKDCMKLNNKLYMPSFSITQSNKKCLFSFREGTVYLKCYIEILKDCEHNTKDD